MKQFKVRPAVSQHEKWAIDLRRQIHEYPEPAYQEFKTSALAKEILEQLGFKVCSDLGQTGLATIWDSGRPGPTVAIRAEMDALHVTEPDGLSFASKNPGMMHACGHDLHLALVLTVARLITKGALHDNICGRVMIICQPAEEGGAGAQAMLKDGLFNKVAKPDFIFSCHNEPLIPFAKVDISLGPAMAGTVDFRHLVHGKGGHAAMPWASANPLPVAANLISALSNFKCPDDSLLTMTMAQGSTRTNVIPPSALFGGTLRYYSKQSCDLIINFAENEFAKITTQSDFKIEANWHYGYPPTINNKEVAARCTQIFKNFLGDEMVYAGKPSFGGEDFSYFLEEIPGAIFFLGFGKKGDAPLHSPDYMLDENIVPIALELWLRLIENFCQKI